MSVDKNLFLYDLAVVAIMKNAAPYVKEWLDYHLLAGVKHFFIYDNESEDNFKEILHPYIDAELVTYNFYPGKAQQMSAYNEAIDNFKFLCRYMALVDDDEFILPKSNRSISEVVEELLSLSPKLAGVEFQWFLYGSNNQEKADYSRGVLERFKRRANKESLSLKSILNPRRVSYMWTPHFAEYQDGYEGLNEITLKKIPDIPFKISEKIVMNHYHAKSWEEYCLKRKRGDGVIKTGDKYMDKTFKAHDLNDVFDDEILKYRSERQAAFIPEDGDIVKIFAARNTPDFDKIFNSLMNNLLSANLDEDFFKGNFETFLTCLNVSNYLKGRYFDEDLCIAFEKLSLNAIIKTLQSGALMSDFQLLMKEMPRLLKLPYPSVHMIRKICMSMIVEWQETLREFIKSGDQLKIYEEILRWNYHLKMLKVFDNYNHK